MTTQSSAEMGSDKDLHAKGVNSMARSDIVVL
jgi:hypothetical protein